MEVTIWSREACPMCDQSKSLLSSKGIEYVEKKIGVNCTRDDLLQLIPNARSVPQIFIDGEAIGGLNELRQRLANTSPAV